MKQQPNIVSKSALPLTLIFLVTTWLGVQGLERERSDAGLWIGFGLLALATAAGVVIRARWAFVLETLLGIAVLAFWTVVLVIWLLWNLAWGGDLSHLGPPIGFGPEPSVEMQWLVNLLLLVVFGGGSLWMLKAGRIGLRRGH